MGRRRGAAPHPHAISRSSPVGAQSSIVNLQSTIANRQSPAPRACLLFDIDGTLIKTGPVSKRVFRRALEETFGEVGRVDSYSFAGKTDPQIVSAVMEGSSIPPEEVLARRQECLDRYLAHYETETRTVSPGTVLPGVREFLQLAAAEPRCVLGLLTGNVARGARLKLTPLGLFGFFRFGAYSSDHPVRDELPAVALRRAHETLGVRFSPEACFVVGDTEHDIRCARAGGMKAVAVATGSASREALAAHRPDYLFDDLTDAAGILARLLERA